MSRPASRTWSPPGQTSKDYFESGAEVAIIVGPVGCGKTSTTINKLLALAALQAPGRDGVRRTRFVIIRSTQQRLLSSTLPSFEEWLPSVGTIRRTSPIQLHIRTADLEIQFDFLGIDKIEDVDRIMGANVSAIVIDEAREIDNLRAILGQLITRAGRFPSMADGGPSFPTRALLMSNPSDKSHDLYKLSVTETPPGVEAFICPPAMLPDRVTANPKAENLTGLSPGYYATLARTMPPDRFDVEVMCEWATMQEGKPLVPEFRASTHVSKTTLMPLRGQPLYIGLDPGNHPAAVIGAPFETERGERRWEIFAELTAENVVSSRFAATLREHVSTRFPGHRIEQVFIDPVAYHPSDRDDEKLLAELYESITGWRVRAPQSNLIDVQLEALRSPFGMLVDGAPAILVDPSCETLIAALAGKVAYREAASGLEKVTTDQIIKRHPWHDTFMAASYLMLGAGGYTNLRAMVQGAKRARHGNSKGVWNPRIGKFVDPDSGQPVSAGASTRMARDVDYPLYSEDRDAI